MQFQLNLDSETVDHAHPTEPLVVAPGTLVRAVFELLKSRNRGSVLICDGGGRLQGIFTERDAVRLMATGVPWDRPIDEIMVQRPVALTSRDTVATAIRAMSQGGYRRMPIVDDENRPIGMLGVTGVLHYMVEHFPEVVYTLPPRPKQAMQEREGA